MPWTGWLRATDISSLTALESRSPISGCWKDWFLLKALRKTQFHASPPASAGYWQSLAFTDSWMHHSNTCFVFTGHYSLCISVFTFPSFFGDTSHIRFRVYPTPVQLHLNWLHWLRPYFQIRLHLWIPWLHTSTYFLGRHISTHDIRLFSVLFIQWIFINLFILELTLCQSLA